MRLFYDARDDRYAEERGDRRLYWLDDLGAAPFSECQATDEGFLFAGVRSVDDYRGLVAPIPGIRDRPAEREPLLRLDTVLDALQRHGVDVPTPRTWVLKLDRALPSDLTYPLFVRTAESSWKLGGDISRVETASELQDEAEALRRGIRWDAVILAREWLEIEQAGASAHGSVPLEVRVWIVDRVPFAWSFHHLHVAPKPQGFPLALADLTELKRLANGVAPAFQSRLVSADFVRCLDGRRVFLEAGPGSCSGTAHEGVFKAVAARLLGVPQAVPTGTLGGLLGRPE